MKHHAKQLCAIILALSMMISLMILPATAAGYVAPTGTPAVTDTTYPTVSAYEEAAKATAAGTATTEQTEIMNSANYVIDTPADWVAMANLVNKVSVTSTSYNFQGKKIYMTDDLDMSAYSNLPCIAYSNAFLFYGSLDGQGYTIDYVTMTNTTNNFFNGLFGFVAGVTIENLVIGSNCVFTDAYASSKEWRGANTSLVAAVTGVTGYNATTIRNVKSQAKLVSNANTTATGGLVGIQVGGELKIENSTFSGSITPSAGANLVRVGGIAGLIHTITSFNAVNCVNEGTVTARESGAWWTNSAGGIVGEAQKAVTIDNCVNKGVVTGAYAGGILGTQVNTAGSVIKNCTHYVNHSTAATNTATKVLGAQGTPSSAVLLEPATPYVTETNNNVYDSTLISMNYQTTAAYSVENKDGKYFSIRFIASGVDATYTNVGFKVTATSHDGKVWDLNTTKVYSSLSATTPDGKTATALEAEEGAYLMALTLKNVPADTDITFVVQPYATLADGSTVILGAPYTTGTVNVASN